ncbi:MAG: transposase, partial [Deltaproteobacteria bacterium]|nr:transposase [Deltaproteobacteria bacterium]
CLAFVVAGYSSRHGYGLIESRQYLPDQWTEKEFAEKRKKTGIPDDMNFKTKNEIALDLVNSIQADGQFSFDFVAADGAFGHDADFLKGLPNGVRYFATIHSDDKFFVTEPQVSTPAWSG